MAATPISPLTPVEPAAPRRVTSRTVADAPAGGFERALEGARVSLSRHAAQRLSRRGLPLDERRLRRLEEGIDRAAARGSDTSLVLLDELALLVKVPERMVMTAMSQSSMRDGVITRIDSAVVA